MMLADDWLLSDSQPLSTHFPLASVMVSWAELQAARGEDLLDVVLDVSDEAGRQVCLLVKQLPQQGDQNQAQGLAEWLVRENSNSLRDVDVVGQVVQVVQQGLVQELEDHLEDVPDCCFFEADASCLRFEVGFR